MEANTNHKHEVHIKCKRKIVCCLLEASNSKNNSARCGLKDKTRKHAKDDLTRFHSKAQYVVGDSNQKREAHIQRIRKIARYFPEAFQIPKTKALGADSRMTKTSTKH